jgi:hypothetical protein
MTMKRSDMPNGGRVMRRVRAAAYLDTGLTKFDESVKDGTIPQGFILWKGAKKIVRAWTTEMLDGHIDRKIAQSGGRKSKSQRLPA